MNNPPDEFLCPILMTLMSDPVIGSDGHTYERSAIITALQRNAHSPMNRAPMTIDSLKPNYALKSLIDRWKADQRKQIPAKAHKKPHSKPAQTVQPPNAHAQTVQPHNNVQQGAIETDHYYAISVYQQDVNANIASHTTPVNQTRLFTPLTKQQKLNIVAFISACLLIIIFVIIWLIF
jgi:hypothetical protein